MPDRIELEDEEREALKAFGEVFHEIDRAVARLSDDDLALLKRACSKVTETNCWCCSFDAAQHLPRVIDIEIYQRSLRTKNGGSADASDR